MRSSPTRWRARSGRPPHARASWPQRVRTDPTDAEELRSALTFVVETLLSLAVFVVLPVLLGESARTLLWTYLSAIFLYALLSLIAPGGYSPLQSVLGTVCEPVLRPIRRLIPAVAGLDLSPLWAIIAIQAILILVR